MSIADKSVLMKALESKLGEALTVVQLTQVLRTVGEELTKYELIRTAEEDFGSTDLLQAFLDAKRVAARSEKTLERYKYLIQNLLDDVRVPVSKINVHHLRGYLSKEKARGIGDSTLEGFREVYSAFFGWLYKESLIQSNPCTNLEPIKVPKKVRTPYTDVDMQYLAEGCSNDRDRALMYFLHATGCRVSEVCALDRTAVDLTARECKVHGKGDKERTVYFDAVTAMMIKRYLDSREDDNPALFISKKRKQRMDGNAVRFILKDIEAKSGGSLTNVHPHRFRRTLATDLIDSGMPIQDVAAILGHEKLDTTMKYVYLSNENIRSAYQRYMK